MKIVKRSGGKLGKKVKCHRQKQVAVAAAVVVAAKVQPQVCSTIKLQY